MDEGKPFDEVSANIEIYEYAQEHGIDAKIRSKIDGDGAFVAIDVEAEQGNIQIRRRVQRKGCESEEAMAAVVFDTGKSIVNELAAIARLKRPLRSIGENLER